MDTEDVTRGRDLATAAAGGRGRLEDMTSRFRDPQMGAPEIRGNDTETAPSISDPSERWGDVTWAGPAQPAPLPAALCPPHPTLKPAARPSRLVSRFGAAPDSEARPTDAPADCGPLRPPAACAQHQPRLWLQTPGLRVCGRGPRQRATRTHACARTHTHTRTHTRARAPTSRQRLAHGDHPLYPPPTPPRLFRVSSESSPPSFPSLFRVPPPPPVSSESFRLLFAAAARTRRSAGVGGGCGRRSAP